MRGYDVIEERVYEAPPRMGDLPGRSGPHTAVTVGRRRTTPLPPPPAWYESLPTWVSISLFLHGLVLLLLISLLGSPETFGIASEGSVDRATAVRTADESALQNRVAVLEQLFATSRASAGSVPESTDQMNQRIAQVEARVGALCAQANPPC
jgi:hypothetical protein